MARTTKQIDSFQMTVKENDGFENNKDIDKVTKRMKKFKQFNENKDADEQTFKRKISESPFEYSLINSNDVVSNEIEHPIQIGNQNLFSVTRRLIQLFIDKHIGIGILNGNYCLYKYWMNENDLNYSKYPFEINPKLLPRIINGFNLLSKNLKN
jgi:hypothetical protein